MAIGVVQPLNELCSVVECAVQVLSQLLLISHHYSFSAPPNTMLLCEQAQERGQPGVSACSFGLAGSLDLFCTERITCLGVQHVERQVSSDLIVMRIPFYWRFIESLRLEKTSKIIKSNCQPNTTMTAKPCPEVLHLHFF